MRAAIKQRIERNFSRFASRYERGAEQQKIAARALLARVEAIGASLVEGPILEIGCGTGLLSESLVRIFPEREVQLTDLSPAMLAECQRKIAAANGVSPGLVWGVLDGEAVAGEADYALIVSGFTLQWFQDLEGTLVRLVRALRCGGRLLASYPGEGSYPEWRAHCVRLGLPCTANPLPSHRQVEQILCHLPVATSFWQQEVKLCYPSARDFFRRLKYTGAGTCVMDRSLEFSQMKRLVQAWDAVCPEGVEVSSRIHYVGVEKQ